VDTTDKNVTSLIVGGANDGGQLPAEVALVVVSVFFVVIIVAVSAIAVYFYV